MSKSPFAFALSLTLALACGGRTSQQEVGGKTSWLSSCNTDADCGSLEDAVCVQQLCTRNCERNGCEGVGGTTCTESGGECLTSASCLPECDDDSDCGKFGGEYTCRGSVCVADSCSTHDATETIAASSSELETPAARTSDTSTSPATPPSTEPSSSIPGGETTTHGTDGSSSSNVVTDFIADDSTITLLCAVSLDEAPAQRPYQGLLLESGFDSMLAGEPGCTGTCGYEYSYFDELWVYNPDLQCPLDISTCEQLEGSLMDNPARCNTASDCTAYAGSFRPCEPFLDQPYYFDSALFTSDERTAREVILNEMQQRGCRRPRFGWDGPTYEIGCVDNLCALVEAGTCDGSPLPGECDACAPNLDAGPSD